MLHRDGTKLGTSSNAQHILNLVVFCSIERISAVRQVEFLQDCPFLHTLALEGNPLDRLEAYRARVIFRLQGLMVLDRNKVIFLEVISQ